MKADKTDKRMGKELKKDVKKAYKLEGHAHHLKMALHHTKMAVKSHKAHSKKK